MSPAGTTGFVGSLGGVSKTILIVLFLFSVVSWAIILYKWRFFRTSERQDQQFLSAYTRAQDREELRRHARRHPSSPCAALFLGVLERMSPEGEGFSREGGNPPAFDQPSEAATDRHYLDRVMAHIVQDEISKHESYLPFLATTGNITPFIGLLGTVLGIIDAFQEIGKQGTASIAAVAPGVAEALVATAAGLFAAIRVEAFSIELMKAVQTGLKRIGVRG
jgi:biopolymer transport protein TolQ